jgi:uncharacterized Zn finger protein
MMSKAWWREPIPGVVYRDVSGICPKCGVKNILRTPCYNDAPTTLRCPDCGTSHPIALEPSPEKVNVT